jgi:myo-inositol-1(or 4)-monophosphatase
MDESLEFSISLAHETGELLTSFFSQGGIHASIKLDQTAVTEADFAADRLITDRIHHNYPKDSIISEESSHFLTEINAPCWVIDPLDGTTNFSLGLPIWGVSIARLVDGHPDLGVLYFPLINEIYTSKAGMGAYLNHQPIATRAPDLAQPMSFFACCSRSFRRFDISIPYKPRIFGSGAYSFCMIARGSALLALDAAPKIWDLAAAWLLVEEAGGLIDAFDGTQIFPLVENLDYNTTDWPVLAACNPALMEMGRKKIQRKR